MDENRVQLVQELKVAYPGVHERPLCQPLNSRQREGEDCSRTFGL